MVVDDRFADWRGLRGLPAGEGEIRTLGATTNFWPRMEPRIGALFGAAILNTSPESVFAFSSADPPSRRAPRDFRPSSRERPRYHLPLASGLTIASDACPISAPYE
jgi:hypothetical protein